MEVRKARRKAATPAPLLPSGTGAPRSRLKPAKAANSSSSNRAEVLLEEGGQGPCQQAVERCASPQGRPIGVSPFSQGCWINVRTVLERFVLTPPLERC